MSGIGEIGRSREGRIAAGAAGVALAAATARQLRRVRMRDGSDGPSRKYRLRRGEPTAYGVRRVARGRLEDAVELLRDEDADPVEAVHEARKDMKKLRSALRLVRPVLGERDYARQNERYRDAAALLSSARDAQVRAETVAGLAERFADEPPPGGWEAVRAALVGDVEPAAHDLDRLRERAAAQIEPGRSELNALSLNAEGAALVEPGLRRAYKRGRERYREALAKPTDERLHEWRKRAKDLWYHLRLLHEGRPVVLEPLTDQADELSDLLGADHDLAVLREGFGGAPLSPGQRDHLERLVAERREELQARAFALGERLYAEKPKAFAGRITAYWESPRVS